MLLVFAPSKLLAETRPHPHVTLDIDACLDADPQEIRRIVGLELGALLTTGDDPFVTSVDVRCREALIDLDVHDPITGKSLTRSIDASRATADGKSRLVALAVAELVAASWIELESNPQPKVLPASQPPSAEAKEAARSTVRSPTTVRLLGVVGQRAVFSDNGTTSWGLGARVAYERASGIGITADLIADHAGVDASLGRVSVDTVSAAPSLTLSQSWARFSIQEAVGVRVGIARVSGETTAPARVRGDTLVSPWGGPFAGLAARLRVGSTLVLELAGEAGYVLLPVSALVDGRREVSLRNLWLGAQLGVGVFL